MLRGVCVTGSLDATLRDYDGLWARLAQHKRQHGSLPPGFCLNILGDAGSTFAVPGGRQEGRRSGGAGTAAAARHADACVPPAAAIRWHGRLRGAVREPARWRVLRRRVRQLRHPAGAGQPGLLHVQAHVRRHHLAHDRCVRGAYDSAPSACAQQQHPRTPQALPSTAGAALAAASHAPGLPLIADERFLSAYRLLEPGAVHRQAPGEGEAAAMLRVAALPHSDALAKRQAVAALARRLNQRCQRLLVGWLAEAGAPAVDGSSAVE